MIFILMYEKFFRQILIGNIIIPIDIGFDGNFLDRQVNLKLTTISHTDTWYSRKMVTKYLQIIL